MKFPHLSTRVKVWMIVSSILIALLLTVSLILVCNSFLYNTINSIFGGERYMLIEGNPDDYVYFAADYANKSDVLKAADSLNERICEEGFVLLKNEGGALPLGEQKSVTVFGKNSVNLVIGGSGSNKGVSNGEGAATVYSSLEAASFVVNPIMKSFYERDDTKRPSDPGMGSILTGFPISETPVSRYTKTERDSYAAYSDAALVVISRICGEGFDLPRTMFWNGKDYTTWSGTQTIPGAYNADNHYLQLDKNETDMLKEACEYFDNVVLIINSSSPMELGFLDDTAHYAYSPKIKAALWIGSPGKMGVNALGRILNGSVNPSGRTVDTYARNFRNDPSWNNFGNNRRDSGNRYSLNGSVKNAYFVEYREGIYVGYRYYETRGYMEEEAGNADWYDKNVVYPFGYGLSYTKFDWDTEVSLAEDSVLNENTEIEITVTVTNTGDRAGKEVVQLYYTPPYKQGEIEKAHVVLGAFGKTDVLQPGESGEVKLSIKARDMASYDYDDANGNLFYGYELEGGKYEIKVMSDAHTPVDIFNYSVPDEGITFKKDDVTKTPIENLFDDVSEHINTYLSRADFEGTWPKTVEAGDLAASQQLIDSLTYTLNDKTSDPWYSASAPNQSERTLSMKGTRVKFYQLYEKDYDDPLWNELMDQLTVEQMRDLISKGNYRTINLNNILKPLTTDADGPMGFAIFLGDPSVYDTCFYASECVVGSTWNDDLALEQGKMVGNEGLIGNEKGDGRPYSGWYAPAMNIHRSQFGGRNFEYYSEDGLLSGRLASAVVKGAKSKGIYTYCKHFALNDQETNRDNTGLITWANEQSMRELYFVPFEMAVKRGGTTAVMSSFNRIGVTWAGGSYNLLTALLRDEWGFRGMVITDYNLKTYMNLDQMIRAGGDLNLSPGKDLSNDASTTSLTAIRKAAKNILYTVANSNAMNGLGENIVFDYAMPYWVIFLICGDCFVGAALVVWGFFVIRSWLKNKTK